MKAHITMRKTTMKNNTTKTYYIYKLVNEANDKVYIGQTRNPQSRFSKCQYRGRKIKDAIESIGWDKFHFKKRTVLKNSSSPNTILSTQATTQIIRRTNTVPASAAQQHVPDSAQR